MMSIRIYPNKSAAGSRVAVGRRLWLTKEGDRLVEDGDPEARSLFCHPHHRVSEADLERLGYSQRGSKAEPEPDSEAPKRKRSKKSATEEEFD